MAQFGRRCGAVVVRRPVPVLCWVEARERSIHSSNSCVVCLYRYTRTPHTVHYACVYVSRPTFVHCFRIGKSSAASSITSHVAFLAFNFYYKILTYSSTRNPPQRKRFTAQTIYRILPSNSSLDSESKYLQSCVIKFFLKNLLKKKIF